MIIDSAPIYHLHIVAALMVLNMAMKAGQIQKRKIWEKISGRVFTLILILKINLFLFLPSVPRNRRHKGSLSFTSNCFNITTEVVITKKYNLHFTYAWQIISTSFSYRLQYMFNSSICSSVTQFVGGEVVLSVNDLITLSELVKPTDFRNSFAFF